MRIIFPVIISSTFNIVNDRLFCPTSPKTIDFRSVTIGYQFFLDRFSLINTQSMEKYFLHIQGFQDFTPL